MKKFKKLKDLKSQMMKNQGNILEDDALNFVVGGAAKQAHAGGCSSSSTSGGTCCDGTCVCIIYCCGFDA